jgi:hypothetical protein
MSGAACSDRPAPDPLNWVGLSVERFGLLCEMVCLAYAHKFRAIPKLFYAEQKSVGLVAAWVDEREYVIGSLTREVEGQIEAGSRAWGQWCARIRPEQALLCMKVSPEEVRITVRERREGEREQLLAETVGAVQRTVPWAPAR